MVETFLISQLKMIEQHMITLEKRYQGILQGDGYATGYLLDHNYLKDYYKMIAIDLSKQQALHADPKAMQQINFTGNINRGEDVNYNTTMFFIIEEAKETILDISEGTAKIL